MSWKEQSKNIGNIKVGAKVTIKFKAVDIPKIKLLQSSCGCSTPHYNENTKELIVGFNPNPVPKHLKAQGHYKTTKTITVTYVDGTKDVLSFTATVNKK